MIKSESSEIVTFKPSEEYLIPIGTDEYPGGCMLLD